MKNSTTCKRGKEIIHSVTASSIHSLKIREYAFQCFIIATLSRYVDYISLWVEEMSEVEHAWWVDFLDTYIRAHTFTTHIYKLTCIEWILFSYEKCEQTWKQLELNEKSLVCSWTSKIERSYWQIMKGKNDFFSSFIFSGFCQEVTWALEF